MILLQWLKSKVSIEAHLDTKQGVESNDIKAIEKVLVAAYQLLGHIF